jgi:NADH-quinone oxidoreductase subunit E
MNTTQAHAVVEAAELSEATQQRFAREVAKYPGDQKQSAVIACLSILQQENGHVTPSQEKALAHYLDMPVMAVHGTCLK